MATSGSLLRFKFMRLELAHQPSLTYRRIDCFINLLPPLTLEAERFSGSSEQAIHVAPSL